MIEDVSAQLPDFVAIDFETANGSLRSAVAMAVTRVVGGFVESRMATLMRPRTRSFTFARIHGIRAADVTDAPDFAAAWRHAAVLLRGARFIAAHHAAFDQGVLAACCGQAGLSTPRLPFLCTVSLARNAWAIFPTRLPDVCQHLGIPLRHHEAGSDADACAEIVRAAWTTKPGQARIRAIAR